jgi:hypothetical protein
MSVVFLSSISISGFMFIVVEVARLKAGWMVTLFLSSEQECYPVTYQVVDEGTGRCLKGELSV